MIFAYACEHGDVTKHGATVLHSNEPLLAVVCPCCWRFMRLWYYDLDETDPEQERSYTTVPTLAIRAGHAETVH